MWTKMTATASDMVVLPIMNQPVHLRSRSDRGAHDRRERRVSRLRILIRQGFSRVPAEKVAERTVSDPAFVAKCTTRFRRFADLR